MSSPLKAGDRVRVTVRNRLAGYQTGDTGTVSRSSVSATGERNYTVAMDKDDPVAGGAVFTEGEIEADEEG
jgi:hypothetical protein